MAKELGVGVVNGVVLGFLLGAGAWIATQGDMNSVTLGLIVAVATIANTLIAVAFGGVMPMLLRKLKVDPAVASGPILTMITDTCGFFFVLALAALLVR
jgi:magnesium transporter